VHAQIQSSRLRYVGSLLALPVYIANLTALKISKHVCINVNLQRSQMRTAAGKLLVFQNHAPVTQFCFHVGENPVVNFAVNAKCVNPK
jgi:hypothetical protein